MDEIFIWNFLFEKLHNAYGVSALMGNLYVESKLNPRLLQSSYARKLGMTSDEYTNAVDDLTYSAYEFINDQAGYGLAQWTYWSRKKALYDFAKSWNASIGDLEMQLNYLWEELQKYKTVIDALYNATDIREASDVVVKKYERPEHQEEKYLENRAKYGREFYDKYIGGEYMVNTADQVMNMLGQWKSHGMKKPDIVVNLANACIGWNYVFGDRGEQCIPAHIKSRISSLSGTYPREAESLKKRCQVSRGEKNCNGCKFYPNGVTLCYDCRGFTYWCFLKGAGITINGAGATSQYNNNANWSEKGLISAMPKDKVCCVFRHDSSTGKMEHTLIYDGQGHYIHDSGEVKKCDVSKYKATHYAIPKGLYDGGEEPVVVIAKAKVVASSGNTVNIRASKSTSSAIVARVPINTIIDVTEKGSDWCGVSFSGKTGYMMTKFLDFDYAPAPTPTDDTVTVKKSELEAIYKMIGGMLGE